MLDIKNIPLYRESIKRVPVHSSKKVGSKKKYMDSYNKIMNFEENVWIRSTKR